MPVISSIQKNSKNPTRCSLYVDGVYFTSCSIDIAVQLRLRKGMELTADIEERLRSTERLQRLKQQAWRYASYAPRTEYQVRTKLKSLETTPEEETLVIDWLTEFGLVNDVAYAERFLHAAQERKPLSPRDAQRRLEKKGVPGTIARAAIQQFLGFEQTTNAAMLVAEKKLRQLRAMQASDIKTRLQRFLQGRGYKWDIIAHVVKNLLPVVLVCLLACFTVHGKGTDSARTVQFSMSILDALTGQPISNARVSVAFEHRGGVTASPLAIAVTGNTARTEFHENERVEITTHANGYIPHQQFIRIRNVDSTVPLHLTVRLFPQHQTIATVEFLRGSDLLLPPHYTVLCELARQLPTKTHITVTALSVSRWYGTPPELLIGNRLQSIINVLTECGIHPKRILTQLQPLPPHPLLMGLTEHPAQQTLYISLNTES